MDYLVEQAELSSRIEIFIGRAGRAELAYRDIYW